MSLTQRWRAAAFALALPTMLGFGDQRAPAGRIGAPTAAASGSRPEAAALPRFALFGWVGPPESEATAQRYAQLARAGLNTTVLAWRDSGRVTDNHARLEFSRPLGVKNLLFDKRLERVVPFDTTTYAWFDSVAAEYAAAPAFLGYYLGDEPQPREFETLVVYHRELRRRDPAHLTWNNLLGRVGFASREAWLAYTRDYAERFDPAVLCNDHYDLLHAGDAGLFVENVAGLAAVARERGIPFWGIVQFTGHGQFREPTAGELRWQVAQWLAFGARGIGYFTYWTPAPDPLWNWQPAMITWDGAETARYAEVRALNLRLAAAGNVLASCTWLSTQHAGYRPIGATPFGTGALVRGVDGRAAIGQFADSTGAPVLFVANADSAVSRAIGLRLAPARRIWRLADDGSWHVAPAEPTAEGDARVTLALAAGDFAVLRMSGDCDGAAGGACAATVVAAPSPARGSVALRASAGPRGARLELLDLSGRRVWSRRLGAGSSTFTWRGERDAGGTASPGVYLARIEDAGGVIVRRVHWLGPQ